MSLLIFIAIVIAVMALLMWAIYYLPMPPGSPTWIKNFLYVVLLIVAVIVIVSRSGVANAQTKPVPQLKRMPAVTASEVYKQPKAVPGQRGWQRFQGATRCEMTGPVVKCDNGYTGRM